MSGLSRREVLRTGGLAVTLGAIAAACGENRGGSTDPGRVGIAPPQPTLPEVEEPASDITILRTAQSMEYAALELYQSLIETGALDADEQALFERIVADHTEDADAMGALVVTAGGERLFPVAVFLAIQPVVNRRQQHARFDKIAMLFQHAFKQRQCVRRLTRGCVNRGEMIARVLFPGSQLNRAFQVTKRFVDLFIVTEQHPEIKMRLEVVGVGGELSPESRLRLFRITQAHQHAAVPCL